MSNSLSVPLYLISLALYSPLALAFLQRGKLDSLPVVLGLALFTRDGLDRQLKLVNLQRWDGEKADWNRWFVRDGSVLAFGILTWVLGQLHLG